jgi:hypothetical protein
VAQKQQREFEIPPVRDRRVNQVSRRERQKRADHDTIDKTLVIADDQHAIGFRQSADAPGAEEQTQEAARREGDNLSGNGG